MAQTLKLDYLTWLPALGISDGIKRQAATPDAALGTIAGYSTQSLHNHLHHQQQSPFQGMQSQNMQNMNTWDPEG